MRKPKRNNPLIPPAWVLGFILGLCVGALGMLFLNAEAKDCPDMNKVRLYEVLSIFVNISMALIVAFVVNRTFARSAKRVDLQSEALKEFQELVRHLRDTIHAYASTGSEATAREIIALFKEGNQILNFLKETEDSEPIPGFDLDQIQSALTKTKELSTDGSFPNSKPDYYSPEILRQIDAQFLELARYLRTARYCVYGEKEALI